MHTERTATTTQQDTERQSGALHSLRHMHGALKVYRPNNITGAIFATYRAEDGHRVRVRVSQNGVVRFL